MASNTNNTIYQTPPLAGRPPFATDDDHLYDKDPQPSPRRVRQSPSPDPNARTSAYNVYNNYLEGSNRDSGIDALGKGMMDGDLDDDPFDDSHRSREPPQQQPIPLAAPKPGYAAPVAALNLARPSPVASPESRATSPQMSQVPKPLMLVNSLNTRIPPPAAIGVPSTPHPLPPTMTPITPVFVRPSKPSDDREVKFAAATPILRGEKEETLIPRRGEKGDDFWRRFSMVIKEESQKSGAEKTSVWLRKTQAGTTRMSRWVWIIGMILLCCVAGGIGLGWWIAHNSQTHTGPTALGGSANEKLTDGVSSEAVAGTGGSGSGASSTSFHVSPTRTVARRDPVYTGVPYMPMGSPLPDMPCDNDTSRMGIPAHMQRSVRHKRISEHLNRLD